MEQGNTRNVWVVYADTRKDFSSAEKFGQLKDVFNYSVTGKSYDSDKLIAYARNVLNNWKDGDYLLMVGDPSLCAICLAVALEYDSFGQINILRWNRDTYDYVPLYCNFDYLPDHEGESAQN